MKLRYKYLLIMAVAAAVVGLFFRIGWTDQPGERASRRLPSIESLSPSAILAGSPGFVLTVGGNSFSSGAVVHWNGAERTTLVDADSSVRAQIMASDIAAGGTAEVTVVNLDNPARRGGTSNIVIFRITTEKLF